MKNYLYLLFVVYFVYFDCGLLGPINRYFTNAIVVSNLQKSATAAGHQIFNKKEEFSSKSSANDEENDIGNFNSETKILKYPFRIRNLTEPLISENSVIIRKKGSLFTYFIQPIHNPLRIFNKVLWLKHITNNIHTKEIPTLLRHSIPNILPSILHYTNLLQSVPVLLFKLHCTVLGAQKKPNLASLTQNSNSTFESTYNHRIDKEENNFERKSSSEDDLTFHKTYTMDNNKISNLFERFVRYNITKENSKSDKTNPIFKTSVRSERNPCYSEFINSSGVYYYYDVIRVFKYIHGYSGWSENKSSATVTEAENPIDQRKTKAVNNNVNRINYNDISNNDVSKDTIMRRQKFNHIVSSELQKEYKNSIYNESTKRNSKLEIEDLQETAASSNVNQRKFSNNLKTEFPYVFGKFVNKKNSDSTVETAVSNVYANPDEDTNKNNNNFLNRNFDKTFNSNYKRYVISRQNLLQEMRRIQKRSKTNLPINPSSGFTSLNKQSTYYTKSPPIITVGNVYADPDIVD